MTRTSRRDFGLRLASSALLIECSHHASAQPRNNAGRAPNFVIILADDLGYGDLGVFGHPTILTPNVDRMAGDGAKLTSFYAAPLCTPARSALLTGRYPIRSGLVRVLFPGEDFGIPDSELTLAEVLRMRGYKTACIGKWHLGDRPRHRPTRHGFDYYYGLLYSNDMTPPKWPQPLQLYRNEEVVESPVNQETLTQRYTFEAIRFIERNKDDRFFLYLPHTMPHRPWAASKKFKGRSSAGLYGDVVEEIDWSTGEILKALQRLGLEKDTMVIFTSDNGPAGRVAGPFRGSKGSVWEGGVRVPFIARWPGRIPGGRVHGGMACLMDLFVTLIEMAGGTTPSDRLIDGRNMMPMLEGKAVSPRPHFLYYCSNDTRVCAIRSGRWKLHFEISGIEQRAGSHELQRLKPAALYNLDEDPSEKTDVSGSLPRIVAELTSLAEGLIASIEPGALPPPRPRPRV